MKTLCMVDRFKRPFCLVIALLALPLLDVGCNGGGSEPDPADAMVAGDTAEADSQMADSADTPTATPEAPAAAPANKSVGTVVTIGDSITAGNVCGCQSYPSRLQGILGTTVVNRGSPGATSSAAPGAAGNALNSKPTHVCIMFGTNDVFREVPSGTVGGNIAAAISRVKSGGAVPVVGTIPPNRKSDFQQGVVNSYNGQIRSAASSGGARLANIAGEMGSGAGLLLEDGFHPNSSGTQIIAFSFADAIR